MEYIRIYKIKSSKNKKYYVEVNGGLSNVGQGCSSLKSLAEKLYNLHKKNIGSFRNQGISFEKPFEMKMNPHELVKCKNLNPLERIFFRKKLMKLFGS